MGIRVPVRGLYDRYIFHVTPNRAARMVAAGQAEYVDDGLSILPFAAQHTARGGRTRTTSGGLIPHQTYTTRDRKARVDGFRFIAPEDVPTFYQAVFDCLTISAGNYSPHFEFG